MEQASNEYVLALAEELGISPHQALCHTSLLIYWANIHARDGVIRYFTHKELANAALWTGDCTRFFRALEAAEWVVGRLLWDRTGLVPVWRSGHRPPPHVWKWIRAKVLLRDDFRCDACGRYCGEDDLQCDHIVPIWAGGSNRYSNLRTVCTSCHRPKSTREREEAIEHRKRYGEED